MPLNLARNEKVDIGNFSQFPLLSGGSVIPPDNQNGRSGFAIKNQKSTEDQQEIISRMSEDTKRTSQPLEEEPTVSTHSDIPSRAILQDKVSVPFSNSEEKQQENGEHPKAPPRLGEPLELPHSNSVSNEVTGEVINQDHNLKVQISQTQSAKPPTTSSCSDLLSPAADQEAKSSWWEMETASDNELSSKVPNQQCSNDQLPPREFLSQAAEDQHDKPVLKRAASLDDEHFQAVAFSTRAKKYNRTLKREKVT